MRWGDDDGEGAGDGDDVDDDPDDARHDGDDDDGDSTPPSGRGTPREISPCQSSSSLCLVSASWRRRKNYWSTPPDVFRSKGSNTPKGSRRGATGVRGGSHPRPKVDPRQGAAPTPWSSPPCALLAP